MRLTEYQQKSIFELFGRNANELINAGLVDEMILTDIPRNRKKAEKGNRQKQEAFAFEMQTIKLLFDNNIPIVEAGDFEKYFPKHERQPYINPKNKQVLLYAGGDVKPQKASEISELGVTVITSKERLGN